MSELNLPVEHYADEINAICARLSVTQGKLALYNVRADLERLGKRDDPEDGGGGEDLALGAVVAALSYY
ncbi:MAG: hypothetical protein F4017_09160, partial [Acidimicrobiaceae bacterium]|nr:hypothetical protein [Acidimicrobiaceae bacterium]